MAVLDGSGLTAFPGLVDQHVHFTGGGGECGFRSRVPELSLTDFTTAGVTTAVGLLGTDSATRSPKALLAKTKALNEEGLTAYCLTGAYDIPSLSLIHIFAYGNETLLQELMGANRYNQICITTDGSLSACLLYTSCTDRTAGPE